MCAPSWETKPRERRTEQGVQQGSEAFLGDGEEKSQGNSVQQARKVARTGRWRVSGGMSLRKIKELGRSTDAFDCVEDQKFGGKVVHTYMGS